MTIHQEMKRQENNKNTLIERIKQELINKKEKAGMLDENIVDPESLDIGFKVFK